MIVPTHAGNEDDVLAVRHVCARKILEIPYCCVQGVVDGMIVDINDFLGWRRRSNRLGLVTVIGVTLEPVLQTEGSYAGIWNDDIHSVGWGKFQGMLEGVCELVPRGHIALDKLSTLNPGQNYVHANIVGHDGETGGISA